MSAEQPSRKGIEVIEYPDRMGKGLSFEAPEGRDGELMVIDNLAPFDFPEDDRDREITVIQGEISFRIPSGPNRPMMEAPVLDRRVPSPNTAHIFGVGNIFVIPAGVSGADMLAAPHYRNGHIILKCVYSNPRKADQEGALDGEQEGVDTEEVGAALKGAAETEV